MIDGHHPSSRSPPQLASASHRRFPDLNPKGCEKADFCPAPTPNLPWLDVRCACRLDFGLFFWTFFSRSTHRARPSVGWGEREMSCVLVRAPPLAWPHATQRGSSFHSHPHHAASLDGARQRRNIASRPAIIQHYSADEAHQLAKFIARFMGFQPVWWGALHSWFQNLC